MLLKTMSPKCYSIFRDRRSKILSNLLYVLDDFHSIMSPTPRLMLLNLPPYDGPLSCKIIISMPCPPSFGHMFKDCVVIIE